MDTSKQLQAELDEAIRSMSWTDVRIVLDSGSDVTDLTRYSDVRVTAQGEHRTRVFTIVTIRWLDEIFAARDATSDASEDSDIYTVGGPLCVVVQITGSAIARAVRRYMTLEQWREKDE